MADQTAVQEAAQALFCALADYNGASNIQSIFNTNTYPIYKTFKDYWNTENVSNNIDDVFSKHVHAPGVSITDIESLFEKDNEWYRSSVSIAKTLILDISGISRKFNKIKSPNWKDIFYVRGDSDVMKNIEKLFKIANKNQDVIGGLVLGDVNKWSPADIYFASNKAKQVISNLLKDAENNTITFSAMNGSLHKLINSGNLLPVSLKKQPNEVSIVKVNFNRKAELEQIQKYGYYGTSDWKPYEENAPQTRHLIIYYEKGSTKNFIKTRHDPSGSGKLTTEVQSSSALARGGSIGSVGSLVSLLKTVDSAFALKFLAVYNNGQNELKKRLKDKDMMVLRSKDKKQFDTFRGKLSAMMVTNKIFPMYIKWLDADKKRADAYIHMIYQYVTSRTELSGEYIIAK